MNFDQLSLMKQRLFIPVTEFQGLVGAAGVGAGVPVHEEIATLLPGIAALEMAASLDEIAHFMMVPSDWDRHHEIKVRVIWSCQSTTPADTVLWEFAYLAITPDITAIADPPLALDTPIVADNAIGTINVIQRTAAGILAANKIADGALYLAFKIAAAEIAAGLTEKVYFHGVEFEYTPKLSRKSVRRGGREWTA